MKEGLRYLSPKSPFSERGLTVAPLLVFIVSLFMEAIYVFTLNGHKDTYRKLIFTACATFAQNSDKVY